MSKIVESSKWEGFRLFVDEVRVDFKLLWLIPFH